jgi:hypothetical protein
VSVPLPTVQAMSRPSTDPRTTTYVWRRADASEGHSVARVEGLGDGWLVHGSEVLSAPAGPLACWFRVAVDRDWVTRAVEVVAFAAEGERRVALRADAERRWSVDGVPERRLAGCLDVDVAATPLTNTFPIRRLAGLAPGERRTADVAWVEVPSLRVLRVEQTYERLGARRWRYGDEAHGTFVIDVDDDGVVVDYEGFATRVREP